MNEYIEEENIRNGNSCDDYEPSKKKLKKKKNNDKSSYLYLYI